ncbi:MAG: mandelate racemase/muconate lactonizing enzyme family protein [Planctomycetota bacterium]|nr:mandelate racemase/muconate lactonizing enzyme family protein [Planctomycetota bacterium]
MKITKVEAIYLRLPVVTTDCDGTQDDLVVLVHTDTGLIGIGEVDSAPTVAKAVIEAPMSHAIANGLANVLIGENPLDISRLWDKMYKASIYYGRFGPAIHAISGIDLALWDIAGKHLKQPVYQLLGGQQHSRLRAYASILFGNTPEETLAIAKQWASKGFTAVKFGWGPFGMDAKLDEKLAEAARTGLGPGRDFMIDVGCRWNWKTAVLREQMLRQFNPFWIEEPLLADDYEGYGKLSERSPTRIAAGEGESNPPFFERLMREGGVDIVQPDVARCGGLTAAMRIADIAQGLGRGVCNHAYKTGISVAASIHYMAAISNGVVLEYCVEEGPLRQETTIEKFPVVNGYVDVPQTPGLGVTLNMATIEKYRQK